MNELVSVVVPVYGVAQYLRQCIDSIINQTYRNLEIILVDDGSTDGSADICDEYAEKDDRIIVIHKENGGLVSARKAGVNRCTGQYTAYVDGDDWISLEYINTLISFDDSRKADMMVCNYIREGKKQTTGDSYFKSGYYERQALEERVFPKMLYSEGFYEFGISQYPHKIFKTELLKKYQNKIPDGISLGEDVALTFPMLLECQSIIIYNEPLYHYRFNEEGISLKYRERTIVDSKRLIDYLRSVLPADYGLDMQLDYYNCVMALVNIVNTARGGLSSGFGNRIDALLDYLNETDLQSSLKRCDFTKKKMSASKRMGLLFLKLKLYKLAVIVYCFKNKVIEARQ